MVTKDIEEFKQNEDKILKKLENAVKENLTLLNPENNIPIDNARLNSIHIENGIKKDNEESISNNIIKTFSDYIGNIPILNPKISNLFNIDKSNLLVSIINHMDDADLETIYFYISIFKMVNGNLPANISLILSIVENQSNRALFISIHNQIPDIINNFYGLAIISETNHNTNLIDISILKDFLLEELKFLIPSKLFYNYYLFSCINLLEKFNSKLEINKIEILEKIKSVHIKETNDLDFISDLYKLISIIKLLDSTDNLNNPKQKYLKNFRKIIKKTDINEFSISQRVEILLIIDLFGIQDDESKYVKNLLDKLVKFAGFFRSEIEKDEFSWKDDKIAFAIEVKMLYWALIACLHYNSYIN